MKRVLGIFVGCAAACATNQPTAAPEARDVDVMNLAPTATRAGHLRFATPSIHRAEAAAAFVRRLRAGHEPAAVRLALVEALPRTGGDFADDLVAYLPGEPDAAVRGAIVATARRAPAAAAAALVARGFGDVASHVRAEAARATASLAQGGTFQAELIAALGDRDADVRVAAAESLGVLALAAGDGALLRATRDPVADVRVAAFRAYAQVVPAAARDADLRRRMTQDDDERVRALAGSFAAAAAARPTPTP